MLPPREDRQYITWLYIWTVTVIASARNMVLGECTKGRRLGHAHSIWELQQNRETGIVVVYRRNYSFKINTYSQSVVCVFRKISCDGFTLHDDFGACVTGESWVAFAQIAIAFLLL